MCFKVPRDAVGFLAGKGSKFKTDEERTNEAQLVIIADSEKQSIIRSCHGDVGGGHFGINKTQE